MKWTINYVDENSKLEKGNQFTWIAGEHCPVFIGYDDEKYYFHNLCTTEMRAYEKSIIEEKYGKLNRQCVYVEKRR